MAPKSRADASKPPSFGLDREPVIEAAPDDLLVDPSDSERTRKIDGVFARLSQPKPSFPERKTTRAWGVARAPGKNSEGKN